MARRRTLFFELPYSMQTPQLTDPTQGLHRLLQRGEASFDRDVTILDAPDHRLLRAGVLLAHRVVDGLGDWHLDAPGWRPWLPADHAEPLGAAADLPVDLAELVRPFRRLATLGPVAAVGTQRRSYTFKDADEVSLGDLHDEKTTIRRNGLTVARFREVTIVPSPAMARAQRRHLAEALRSVGATAVDGFPELVQRLGAPATGLTDFPEPSQWDSGVSLETFVSQLFATRLQDIVRADLALRASTLARQRADEGSVAHESAPRIGPLLSELAQLRHQVASLSGVLEPGWREGVEADLALVLDQGEDRRVSCLDDRYYAVLDALIAAVRAPQLGHRSNEQAAPVLRRQLESGVRILVDRCQRLAPDSPDSDWEAALVAARQLLGTTEGLGILFGKLARKVAKQLRKTQHLLEPCQTVPNWPDEHAVQTLTPAEAFEAGRSLQRAGDARDAARRQFVKDWPVVRDKLWALRKGS